MNWPLIKQITLFVLGGGIGGIIGAVISGHLYADDLSPDTLVGDDSGQALDVMDEIDNQKEKMSYYLKGKQVTKEEFDAWYENPKNDPTAVRGIDLGEQPPVVLDEKKLKTKKKSGKTPAEKPTDYTAISKNTKPKPSINDLAKEILGDEAVVESVNLDLPYIISFEEFLGKEAAHNNGRAIVSDISLTYYQEDDILVDEIEAVITDPDKIIGGEALLKFGQGSQDPDTVYVRNQKLATDYEITRNRGSYTELVLGQIPEKKRQQPSRRTRKVKADDADEDKQ